MAEPHELLNRDQLIADAIALGIDADRSEGAADALDAMPQGDGSARRAKSERERRAGDLCLLLSRYDDAILAALADGSIAQMLQEARAAARRRKAIGGR